MTSYTIRQLRNNNFHRKNTFFQVPSIVNITICRLLFGCPLFHDHPPVPPVPPVPVTVVVAAEEEVAVADRPF
jgi:hypothetical protein